MFSRGYVLVETLECIHRMCGEQLFFAQFGFAFACRTTVCVRMLASLDMYSMVLVELLLFVTFGDWGAWGKKHCSCVVVFYFP